MKSTLRKSLVAIVALAACLALAWGIWYRLSQTTEVPARGSGIAPVEVATVERRPIRDIRVLSGTLITPAEVQIAAKVGGRVVSLAVDFADEVERGQLVAELDDAEYLADLAAAEADLKVARAQQTQASSAYEISTRELGRVQTLQERGVSSEAQYDQVRAGERAANAQVEVANAQVARAEAAVEAAKVRLGYATINAEWTDGPGGERVVAQRFVEEGDTVAANTPLYSIVVLDPLRAVVFVNERDYARLQRGQTVTLTTDAFPGESFDATVDRVAPVFDEGSRQARIELNVPNADYRLRPGLFVRAETVLDVAEQALVVPEDSITRRGGGEAVFVIREADDGLVVELIPVKLGIRENGDVQLLEAPGTNPGDRVVTLGQQLLDDGAAAVIPEVDGGAE